MRCPKIICEKYRASVRTVVRRVVFWYLISLAVLLPLAGVLGLKLKAPIVILGVLFYYVDIFGLDGGSVWGLAKIVGGRGSFERHLSFVSWWKLPVLLLQIVGLLLYTGKIAWGIYWYYTFILAEVIMFYITMREVHALTPLRATLVVALILTVMIPSFLSQTALRELTNILVQK